VAQNRDARGPDEPEHGGKGRSPQAERDCDDEESRVQLGSGCAPGGKLEVVALELANSVHATHDKDYDKEQQLVVEQAVDAEHGEDGGVVAREVSKVEVDPALHLAKVGGLRDTLQIKELGDRAQRCESRGHGSVAEAIEAAREARRQSVDGDAEARHDEGRFWGRTRVLGGARCRERGKVAVEPRDL
jgi:nucleoid-associated protein YgaU